MPARLEPLPPEQWDDLVKALATRPPEGGERALNIFTTLDRHPDLFRRWVALGGALLNGKLDSRRRELVILRTAHHCQSDYEWAQHVPIAASVGVEQEEIDALQNRLDSHQWVETDLLILEAADELHETFGLTDRTWHRLSDHFDAPSLIELVMLVAFYHLVALMISALQIQIEDF